LLGPRWNALYVLGRKKGLGREQAEDAVQSFFERLLDGDVLERLEPSRGRLRAYLRTAFQRHLINLHASEAAHKRGGGRRALDLEAMEEFLASSDDDPERLFDRAFAISLFESALLDLKAGRSSTFANGRTGSRVPGSRAWRNDSSPACRRTVPGSQRCSNTASARTARARSSTGQRRIAGDRTVATTIDLAR
jgi:hypothetical protein